MKIKLAIALEQPIDFLFPENYDAIYARISPLPQKAEVTIDTLSLDAPEQLLLADPNGEQMIDNASKHILRKNFQELLKNLTPREQKIINLRFGLNDGISHTLDEVGHEFGVNRERIRQIEYKALDKLKEMYDEIRFKDERMGVYPKKIQDFL